MCKYILCICFDYFDNYIIRNRKLRSLLNVRNYPITALADPITALADPITALADPITALADITTTLADLITAKIS